MTVDDFVADELNNVFRRRIRDWARFNPLREIENGDYDGLISAGRFHKRAEVVDPDVLERLSWWRISCISPTRRPDACLCS